MRKLLKNGYDYKLEELDYDNGNVLQSYYISSLETTPHIQESTPVGPVGPVGPVPVYVQTCQYSPLPMRMNSKSVCTVDTLSPSYV
jgi:hypothetical protein